MYDFFLFLHFVGLAMGLGTSFTAMVLGISSKKLPEPERTTFLLRVYIIGRIGSVGLVLLILSGLYLLFQRGVAATFSIPYGLFHLKMTLVVILCVLLGIMDMTVAKVKREKGGPAMTRIPKISSALMLTTLAIVLTASYAFH